MDVLIVLFAIAVFIMQIMATVRVAEWKKRSKGLWGVLAFLFGALPLIVLVFLDPATPRCCCGHENCCR